MRYELGKKFICYFKGEAKEIKDFGYPIPDVAKNQYELDNLFTHRSQRQERSIKYEDDYNNSSVDTISNVNVLRIPPRKRWKKRMDSGIFKYALMDSVHDRDKAMGVDTIKRRNGNYKFKKLF